jgi:hypothetical protein
MKLDKQNRVLNEECSRLRAEFKCQEDDRQYLVKQNLLVRKENDGLKGVMDKMRGQMEMLFAERRALSDQLASLQHAHVCSCAIWLLQLLPSMSPAVLCNTAMPKL